MSNLRKALRLAAELDKTADFQMRAIEAAAELRRLHEVNQALLKTLESYEAENEQLWGFVKGFIQSVKAKEQI
jgi:hypothetical protein